MMDQVRCTGVRFPPSPHQGDLHTQIPQTALLLLIFHRFDNPHYRKLEILTLREIEQEHILPEYQPKTFQTIIDKINTLLDRVQIERADSGFNIVEKGTTTIAKPEEISSGEAELVSLAIEFLSFQKECDKTKMNFLIIDEPDVHLHPDLQDRLAVFISDEISSGYLTVIIASHSTSFVGALAREGSAKVVFMKRGDTILQFNDISEVHQKILPMFGAHPLSNIFNEAPILLVEGEDDERIWQQVVRSSVGAISVYPCVAGTVVKLNEFEVQANNIITSVYDSAFGYSLRDRDDNPEEIEDVGSIKRMRLSCRTAENLLLSDDVLVAAGSTWEDLQVSITTFVEESTHHPKHTEMKTFLNEGLDRKNADLKEIRLILAGLITTKPWEVLVGQTIASLKVRTGLTGDNSLIAYLGAKVCTEVCKLS
jgi:ABC-type multidrug transport system ATPase subunit